MEPTYQAVHHIPIISKEGQEENILITESILLKKHSHEHSYIYIFLKVRPLVFVGDPYSYIILLTEQARLTDLEEIKGFNNVIGKLIKENWPRDIILQIALDIVDYAQKTKDNKMIREIIDGLEEYSIAKYII